MDARHKINIIFENDDKQPDKEVIKRVINKVLRHEGIKSDIGVNILLTDDKKIKALNRQFLNIDSPTDVIAFGAKYIAAPNKKLKGFIGEIVISVEMAEYNAKRFNTTKEKEIFLYIIHAILHLLGYGDKTKKEKKVINERQSKILEEVCGQLIS